MSTHEITKAEIMALQRALGPYGYLGDIDGRFGLKSYNATQAALAREGMDPLPPFNPLEVILPIDLMIKLGILTAPKPKPRPKGLFDMTQATILDYLLNFAQSKIVWAAGALVGLVVSLLATKWGLQIDDATQKTIAGWLVTGGSALIMLLRTFFNAPKVAIKQPEIVTKP